MKEIDGVKSVFEAVLQKGSQMETGFATFDQAGRLLTIDDSFLGLSNEEKQGFSDTKAEQYVLERSLGGTENSKKIKQVVRRWRSSEKGFIWQGNVGDKLTLSRYITSEGKTCYLKVPLENEGLNDQIPSSEVLFDVIQSLDIAVALYDADLCFVLSNQKYADMIAVRQDQLRPGQPIHEIMQGLTTKNRDQCNHDAAITLARKAKKLVNKIIESITRYEKGLEVKGSDGRVLLSSSHETEFCGYLVTIKDITEQKKIEEASYPAPDFKLV